MSTTNATEITSPVSQADGGVEGGQSSPTTVWLYVAPKRTFADLAYYERHRVLRALRWLRDRYTPAMPDEALEPYVRHLNNIEDYVCGRHSLLACRRTLQ